MTDFSNVERNIKGFFGKYGKEGYIELFLTNYLYEFTMYWLRSEDKRDSYNSALKFHLKGEDIASLKETQDYQVKIKASCSKKAKQIVSKLKVEGLIEKWETIPLEDPKLNKLLQSAIDEVFESTTKNDN